MRTIKQLSNGKTMVSIGKTIYYAQTLFFGKSISR